ncbi:hypothetical protein BDD12DRAFT_6442 [Trichophaea hybrida]|nr:hypothetical protein BDD12DRAFT_6442 [Trichophaea hybrida]
MSLKALLNYVLDEVAIDGEEGTSIEELFHHVNNFYVENLQRRHNVCELLGADQLNRQTCGEDGDGGETNDNAEPTKPNPDKGSDFWGVPNVKEEFQEYIWDLLRQEKDFIVGPKNEAGNMTLKDIVEKMKMRSENDDFEQLRVYASEDRRWRTLTGHGPDPRKVENWSAILLRPRLTISGSECSLQVS